MSTDCSCWKGTNETDGLMIITDESNFEDKAAEPYKQASLLDSTIFNVCGWDIWCMVTEIHTYLG